MGLYETYNVPTYTTKPFQGTSSKAGQDVPGQAWLILAKSVKTSQRE